jgi:hypothetical protein
MYGAGHRACRSMFLAETEAILEHLQQVRYIAAR